MSAERSNRIAQTAVAEAMAPLIPGRLALAKNRGSCQQLPSRQARSQRNRMVVSSTNNVLSCEQSSILILPTQLIFLYLHKFHCQVGVISRLEDNFLHQCKTVHQTERANSIANFILIGLCHLVKRINGPRPVGCFSVPQPRDSLGPYAFR